MPSAVKFKRYDGFDNVVTCIVKEITGPNYIGRLCKMRRRLRKMIEVKNKEKKKKMLKNKNKVKILLVWYT